MKINIELNEEEETLVSEAFESAIAECLFSEYEEEFKDYYFERVQTLINKFGLKVNVDKVIDELIDLNKTDHEDFDENIDLDED